MSNVIPASTPNAATSTPQPVEQHAPSGTPKSATIASSHTQQNPTAQWPDEHLDLIADTGSKLLDSLPQNAEKTMKSKTIRDMLRTNPSYDQVCEMIESKSFHMDRSKFASTLLSVISPNHPPPSQAQVQEQSVARAEASNVTQVNTGEKSLSSAAAAMQAHEEALAASRSGFSQTPAPTAPAPPPARPYNIYQPTKYGDVESGTIPIEEVSFVREGRAKSQAQSQSGPAKPAAAEKGKYTSLYQSLRPEEDDFVPTQMDEDDYEGYQNRLSELQAYNKGSGSYKTSYGAPQNGTAISSTPAQTGVVQTTAQRTYFCNSVWAPPGQASRTTPQQQNLYPYQSPFSPQNNNRPATLQGSQYKQIPWGYRINSGSEAGARARNPFGASSCRVNSATPQPQMLTPGMQKNVQTLYSTPNLQTNSIEEGSRSYQQHIAKNPLLNFDGIVLPIDTSVARRWSKYDPKTITRDILISTGRHPSEHPLNSHLEPLKNFRAVNNQSDLSTFRWDIVDPGGDEVGSLKKELRERLAAAKMAAGSRRGPVPTRGNPFGINTKPRNLSRLRNETIEIEDDDAMDVDDEGMPPPQSVRAPKEGTQTPGRRSEREARNPAPKYRPMPAAELRKLQHDAGRRYRVDTEQTPPEAEGKPPAEYVKFACNWEKCDRVLVNLATLRRHIFIMHGKHDDVVQQGKVCMWHGCGNKDYSAEHYTTPGTFCENLKVFREHMEDTHLKSVAFLYGDGAKTDVYGMFFPIPISELGTPKNSRQLSPLCTLTSSIKHTLTSPLDNDSNYDSSIHSAFLNDCEGRQVTPSVVDQPVEKGKNSELNNEARIKKLAHEGKRKDRIIDFWNIEHFEPQPLKLDARKSTGGLGATCTARFIAAQRKLEDEYGAELAEAAKMNEGLPEASKKKVYSHDMPKALREKLVV